jgi:hypothetical protein
MRYLEFQVGRDEKKYEVLYQGCVGTLRGFEGADTRVFGNVLDKVERLGRPIDDSDGASFALTQSGVVALEDVEYRLLLEAFNKVRWTPKGVRTAAEVREWILEAPKQEPSSRSQSSVG